ncbi:hypothetical protein M0534_02845 [Methylonatrum kenyense]|uniref:hypothetical protein n=1 Tax=Methylonatrum kenyense TaxID=455253 RepID=UPI0020BFB1D7|nr:hypothetical protein [Methylonatrum kenyense]MCK8515272.1 hypothetical protein [Methylonatrum kenyense]
MPRWGLTLVLAAALASGAAHGFERGPYPERGYAGVGVVNDVLGAQLELANPVGSIWVMVGYHLDVPGSASFERGRQTGFVGGFRLFSGGGGLESSWYAGGVIGTLEVDTRREDGDRKAYQRLGFGGTLGYQFISGRLRTHIGLGAAYLEPYTADDDTRVRRDYIPLFETGLSLSF